MQIGNSSQPNQRSQGVFIALSLAVVGTVVVSTLIARGRGIPPKTSTQEVKKVNLSVHDPRPVAEAIRMLETKYEWLITYEDPRYVHESEIADETEFHKYRPAEPRVPIPKGGALAIDYDVTTDTEQPLDREAVIQQLLDANTAAGNAGRFRIEKKANSYT